ncbi:MAG TPA: DNA polymerase III subunit gamma/tau [Dehalococcoidia bacterium]|nr:DNA polymerase III subunit gamma/tau [Dehalococcoidia bacterium]
MQLGTRSMTSNNEVFYRKWRPQRFDEVAGQDHVTKTLRQALRTNRVAHAYLLCGPRGTGKTSTARILAKALNCTDPRDGEPCGGCDNCVAVTENRMLDLIEIDAASNRGIDNIRDLRDKARFAPGSGKYKVYVIDEVHQLTAESFNALLKTLEEPPPHVIFVLATTETHRVPATILSRCQRFDFRRLSNDVVIDKLAEIAGEEEIDADPEVLALIARTAYGSLRDAENLLEQLAVSYGSEINLDQALELLGLGDTESSTELAVAALQSNPKSALEIINREAAKGADIGRLRSGAVDVLRAGLLVKAGVEDALGQSQDALDAITDASRDVTLEKLLNIVTELEKADFRQNPSSPLPLEIALLNAIADRPAAPVATAIAAAPAPTAPARSRPAAQPGPAPTRRPQPSPTPSNPQVQPRQPAPVGGGAPPQGSTERPPETVRESRPVRPPQDERWDRVIKELARTQGAQFNLGAILRGVQEAKVDGDTLSLSFRQQSMDNRVAHELADPRGRGPIEMAVEKAYAVKLKVVIAGRDSNGAAKRASMAMDSDIVRLAITMGARIVDEGTVNNTNAATPEPANQPAPDQPEISPPETNPRETDPDPAG